MGRKGVENDVHIIVNDLGVLQGGTTEIETILMLPIHSNGKTIGVIGAANKKHGGYFEESEVNYLSVIRDSLEAILRD